MKDEPTIEGAELAKFLEKYEIKRLRDDFKGRIITIVIASLGLIAALAWDEALKHLFEKLFGGSGTLREEIAYAIIITGIAAAISVYISKYYKKRSEK